jgi:hypothetical protein
LALGTIHNQPGGVTEFLQGGSKKVDIILDGLDKNGGIIRIKVVRTMGLSHEDYGDALDRFP